MAVLTSLPTVMQRYLAEGHMVKLDGIGTFYLTVQCTKTGVENKEDCSQEQITNVKVQFRPEMVGNGRKGQRRNTLVADDLEWTYLPATEKKPTEESGSATPTGGGSQSGSGSGNGGSNPPSGGDDDSEQ